MSIIKRLLEGVKGNKAEFKEKYKQAEIELKIAKTLEERSKSSNRRELEKYVRDQEESKIKMELDKIHKQQNSESWKSNHSVMNKGKSILHEDTNILKQKNIFKGNKNNMLNKGGMFF